MYILENNYEYEYIIKKSKFIVKLINIDNNSNINSIIDEIKDIYPKATHYCYAYVLNNYSKYNDDGEPSGTAGLPILSSLNNKKLTNVLCVVIRYFGGIKLGASGLTRTYAKVVRDAIDSSKKLEYIEYQKLEITFKYDKVNTINNILKECIVIDKTFDEDIKYLVKIPKNIYIDIKNILINYCEKIIDC